MSNLFGLGIENIKLFKEKTSFSFAPITILTGANSSGKSTLSSVIKIMGQLFKDNIVKYEPENEFISRSIQFDKIFKKHTSEILNSKIADFKNLLPFDSVSDVINISIPVNIEDFDCKYELTISLKISSKEDEPIEIIKIKIHEAGYQDEYLIEAYGSINDGHKMKINYLKFYDNLNNKYNKLTPLVNELDNFHKNNPEPDYENDSVLLEIRKRIKENFGNNIEPIFFDDHWTLIDFEIAEELNNIDSFDDLSYLTKKGLIDKKYQTFNFLKLQSRQNYNLIYEIDLIAELENNLSVNEIDFEKENLYIINELSKKEYKLSKSYGHEFSLNFVSFLQLVYPLNQICEIKNVNVKSLRQLLNNVDYQKYLTQFGNWFFSDCWNKISTAFSESISSFNVNDFKINDINISESRHIVLENSYSFKSDLVFYIKNNKQNISEEQEFINQWLVNFNIGEKILLDKDEQVVRIKIEKNNSLINIADEGFGVSKLIPLLIKIVNIAIGSTSPFDYYSRYPSILILEEPEIGLHPALQSKLMEMFFDAFLLFNIQIIIETHSEYLIRKLQVMTADSQNRCTTDHSQVYYFYNPNEIPEGEQQVYPINIEGDGSMTRPFGKGFYDESTNLNIALYNFSKVNKN